MKKSSPLLFLVLLYLVILSPYLSSWLPLVGGMPAGPILRQLAFGLVFIAFFWSSVGLEDLSIRKIRRLYALICILTLASFFYGPSSFVQYAVGVASFVFYPAVFLFSVILLDDEEAEKSEEVFFSFDKFFVGFFMVAAFVGTLDVAMDGGLVELLGYNPNYGGDDFSLITSYNGVVRANAGISDALAFGYLMAVAVIYFFNRSSRISSWENVLGIGLCTLACMLSLTRGAMISVFLTYMVYMLTLRRFMIMLMVLPIAGYIIYVSPYADLFLGRFTDSDESSETSSLLRLVMALNSIDFLSQNPMGIGIGTQGAGNVLSDTDNRLNTDNYFFHIFLELGLFFGPVFILFLYKQFSFAFKRIKSGKFFLSYALLFLVSSALSSSIAFATLGVVYWFVLYLIVLESKISHED